MRTASIFIVLAFCPCCFSQNNNAPRRADKTQESKLDAYFASYCDYTGNMGIGFVASNTYDFKFRQRLKTTQDTELKRLFVLQYLYRDTMNAMDNLERGIVNIGKGEERKMTAAERERARAGIAKCIQDLTSLDPGDPEREIAEFRARLNKAPR